MPGKKDDASQRQLQRESKRAYSSEACKREHITQFEDSTTDNCYKFEVPGEKNYALLLQALGAAPHAKTATKRKESKWGNTTSSEQQILTEVKTLLEEVKTSVDKLTQIDVSGQPAKKIWRPNALRGKTPNENQKE